MLKLQSWYFTLKKLFYLPCQLCLKPCEQGFFCVYCDKFLPRVNLLELNKEQRKMLSPLQDIVVAFNYVAPISALIKQLKYKQELFYARILSYYLALAVNRYYLQVAPARHSSLPEALVFVPAFPTRYMQRGLNHSLELARILAKRLELPLFTGVYRIKDTKQQIYLNRVERTKNVESAFLVKEHKFSHIAIVDDVLTTGSTVASLAKELLNLKAVDKVSVFCCAY